MAKPRKNVSYTADKATVKRFFRESMEAQAEQKVASGLVSDQNVLMATAGVHPGVLSYCRRIAAMPEGKRGFFLYLTKLYFQWLEEELEDATFRPPAEAEAETQAEAPAESEAPSSVPFGRRTVAA